MVLVLSLTLFLIILVCLLNQTRIYLCASVVTTKYVRGAKIVLRKKERNRGF
jgi:hypothetical protein